MKIFSIFWLKNNGEEWSSIFSGYLFLGGSIYSTTRISGQWKADRVDSDFYEPPPPPLIRVTGSATNKEIVSTHHVTSANVFPDGVCSCAVSRGNLVTFPVSLIVMTSSLLASLMNMRTATGEQPTQQQQQVVVKIDSETSTIQNQNISFT